MSSAELRENRTLGRSASTFEFVLKRSAISAERFAQQHRIIELGKGSVFTVRLPGGAP